MGNDVIRLILDEWFENAAFGWRFFCVKTSWGLLYCFIITAFLIVFD